MNAVILRFALYRALVRQGLRVPLPDELTTSSPLGPSNPIKNLIRNAFRRNKRDTSPRLVVSALKNGYRFLSLLSRAADPASAEHASVLAFLRENESRILEVRAKKAAEAAARISTAPIPGRTPLIKKISAEGEPPVYAPAGPPRPLSSFPSGVRKPPTLGAVGGVPFLRLKKPQPRFLERVIRQTAQRREKKIIQLLDFQTEGLDDVALEDQWEWLVGRMLADKAKEEGKTPPPVPREPTYRQTLHGVTVQMSKEINEQRLDLLAKSHAMWQIVLNEQALALQEEKERLAREGKDPSEAKLRDWRRPIWDRPKRKLKAKKQREAAVPEQPEGAGVSKETSSPEKLSPGTTRSVEGEKSPSAVLKETAGGSDTP
ncbi:9e1eeeb2-3220-4dbe-ae26-aaa8e14f70d9 [Thermothielavioides terrestris]|uniref:9e1eeeb2-3220-4dbe-ae26-aaa8e14f70d9 n=1 Tax=Thermothielavioides terrestris TaxID=2587410 RepID=A0A3S4B6T2_9PEZI|nr:9e1eeeb2-3220-4dbe-ae26-aaa8e14f70d9 [Thermothielavioides terrestris]